MIKKVKTKKKRNSIMNDEFMKWFIPARENAMRYKLPHDYIFNGKLYQFILNYEKWHKKKHDKTTKEYLMQDYLQYIKDSQKKKWDTGDYEARKLYRWRIVRVCKQRENKKIKEID